ncbi:hypothetical protein QL104_07495 [Pseudomonas piscis]|uniref:DUF3077 domain-containing protein n=1 Tax=Pseudomonas piscis TaxID=2614538 RepID=A0ABY9NLW2_9PSED|nr:hypothetical protein [Pseudomonas piscis]WMN19242.1 hypothetical protein QL104_07495 [Pseudomonas piscis]
MHPKNSTTPPPVQPHNLRQIEFCNAASDGAGMLRIAEAVKITDGLYLAADLAEGIKQLCDRIHSDINEGELTYLAEVKALGFLADTVGALVRASEYSMRHGGGEQ